MATTEALADFGPLQRASVAADNSCLFTTFAKLCAEPAPASEPLLKAAGRELRAVCGGAGGPGSSARRAAGHDSVAAGEWIRNEMHWGGKPEIVMLAEHLASRRSTRVRDRCARCGTATRAARYPRTGRATTRSWRGRRRGAQLRRRRRRRRRRRARGARDRARTTRSARRARRRAASSARVGAILADAAAFQLHCGEVDHDDDFTCAAPRRAAQFFGAIFANFCVFRPPRPPAQVRLRAGRDRADRGRHASRRLGRPQRRERPRSTTRRRRRGDALDALRVRPSRSTRRRTRPWRGSGARRSSRRPRRRAAALLKRALAAQYATPAAAESGLVAHLLARPTSSSSTSTSTRNRDAGGRRHLVGANVFVGADGAARRAPRAVEWRSERWRAQPADRRSICALQ